MIGTWRGLWDTFLPSPAVAEKRMREGWTLLGPSPELAAQPWDMRAFLPKGPRSICKNALAGAVVLVLLWRGAGGGAGRSESKEEIGS